MCLCQTVCYGLPVVQCLSLYTDRQLVRVCCVSNHLSVLPASLCANVVCGDFQGDHGLTVNSNGDLKKSDDIKPKIDLSGDDDDGTAPTFSSLDTGSHVTECGLPSSAFTTTTSTLSFTYSLGAFTTITPVTPVSPFSSSMDSNRPLVKDELKMEMATEAAETVADGGAQCRDDGAPVCDGGGLLTPKAETSDGDGSLQGGGLDVKPGSVEEGPLSVPPISRPCNKKGDCCFEAVGILSYCCCRLWHCDGVV